MAKSTTAPAATSQTGFGTQANPANGGDRKGVKKTTCPITREHFRKGAKPVLLAINGVPMLGEVKEFSTGSLGWYLSGKTTIEVDGVPVSVQLGFNLTIVGSKELPQ